MRSLSDSPTETPDRPAASRAAVKVSGRRPLRLHGPPDFIGGQTTSVATWIALVCTQARSTAKRRARSSVLVQLFVNYCKQAVNLRLARRAAATRKVRFGLAICPS